jgi:ABC-type transporter Mla subunit MlaD
MANKDSKVTKEDIKNAESFASIFRNLSKDVQSLFTSLNAVGDEVANFSRGYQIANKSINSLTSTFGKLIDIQAGYAKTNSKDLKTLQDKALAEKKNLTQAKSLLEAKEKLKKIQKHIEKTIKKKLKNIMKIIKIKLKNIRKIKKIKIKNIGKIIKIKLKKLRKNIGKIIKIK